MILKCLKCGRYSLSDTCEKCFVKTKNPHPPKFSLPDKYGKYRRIARKNLSIDI